MKRFAKASVVAKHYCFARYDVRQVLHDIVYPYNFFLFCFVLYFYADNQEDPRRVIVTQMAIVIDGRPDVEIDLTG